MALGENLERGFNLGYKSSRFAPLGEAIKSTIAAYNQQNQLESGLAAKAGMERLFQDPLERQVKQAQLQKAQMEIGGFVSPEKALDMKKTGLEINKLNREEETANQLAQEKADTIIETTKSNLDTIKSVKEGINYFGRAGGVPTIFTPQMFSEEGYASRKKWENSVNQLLAQKGFDMMKELKDASKTGATGLGPLSENEGVWLKQASTALTRDISPKDAMDILNEMERIYNKVLSGGIQSNNPFANKNSQQNSSLSPREQELKNKMGW